MSSVDVGGVQGPLFTVHRSTYVPTAKLVTAVVALAGVPITAPAGPLTMLQMPVAGAVAAVAASAVLAKALPLAVHSS